MNCPVGQRVLLSLGSNVGERARTIRAAIEAIGELEDTRVCAVSHGYESEPWGVADQPLYLNVAAEIETVLSPLELLNAVKAIERRLGRVPGGLKWGPRVIDIDLVLWGDAEVSSPELTLPHPEFRRRAFVLEPLAEIAGAAVDPVTGLTVAELARRPEVEGKVWKVAL
jgi:2-amino-4-hydroxy-6-hydroxymethyldihydropteridine diphosphokinase